MRLNGIKDNPGRARRRASASAAASARVWARWAAAAARARRLAQASRSAASKAARCRLHRRLPKRGFNKWRPEHFNEVNVGALQQAIDDKRLDGSKPVDAAALIEAGIVRRAKDGLRLLGDGEIKAKIAITVNHATAKAQGSDREGRRQRQRDRAKVLAADEESARSRPTRRPQGQEAAAAATSRNNSGRAIGAWGTEPVRAFEAGRRR